MIEKRIHKVNDFVHKLKYVETSSEVNNKMKIRYAIQKNVADGNYDAYELLADVVYAMNDLIAGKTIENSENIQKYVKRQKEIAKVLVDVNYKRK